MRLDHKALIIRGLRFPLKGLFHVTRQSNFNFEIVKKSVDVGKDLIRTNVQWMTRLHRLLPIIGLIIGVTSFTLQTLIILFDKNRSLPTKIAAAVLFLALSSLAVTAFILAETAPIVATGLALGISILNFSADFLKFFDGFRDLRKNKRALSNIDEEQAAKEKHERRETLIAQQMLLKKRLVEQLQTLLEASKQGDKGLYDAILSHIHDTVIKLVKTNERIQSLCSPKSHLEKKIAQQSQDLTIAAIALTINILSISLVTYCLVTTGILPIGVSLLLCVNLLVDLAELSKNVVARCREKKLHRIRSEHRLHSACELIDEATNDIGMSEDSYRHMLTSMSPTKKLTPLNPSRSVSAYQLFKRKNAQKTNEIDDDRLQLTQSYSL